MTRHATACAGPIVHVVQHLRPGGLEVMALELARAQQPRHATLIVSLEGSFEEASAQWPRLLKLRGGLHFMGKRPGLDPLLVPRLIALYMVRTRTCPDASEDSRSCRISARPGPTYHSACATSSPPATLVPSSWTKSLAAGYIQHGPKG